MISSRRQNIPDLRALVESPVYRLLYFSDNPQLWEEWSSIFCRKEEHEGNTGPEAAKLYFEANRLPLRLLLSMTDVNIQELKVKYQKLRCYQKFYLRHPRYDILANVTN